MLNPTWAIIYHDGTKISVVKSTKVKWNDCETNNVQFLLVRLSNRYRSYSGIDDYIIDESGAETKCGKLITDEQFKECRNYMVSGKWK